ncbi:inositol monophosphatase [Thiomicrospira sp. ALE5]|uniref:inositol monophosphatase family protein n=1 Tax=Thiomicrospira sp. ALE5 TaxID=748650 RepID=UPI0008EB7677|nr:inositol monophosphatase [Thiomicrospira sp. ALE5]SFR59678.1 myo-inositol-1(or 4)-monophosphatase [Thiomicrospira sp. ALE5]
MSDHPFCHDQAWLDLQRQVRHFGQQEIQQRFQRVNASHKQDGSLLTEADTATQTAIKSYLAQNWPQFAFLGEESELKSQQNALKSPLGCWVLDPVDGTTNFAHGIDVYSLSLALVIEGQVVAGLVYDPARDELFHARIGQGAFCNEQPLHHTNCQIHQLDKAVGIIDFKRLENKVATKLATEPPYASQRSFGSVALDWCWIAAGRGEVYLHGSQSLWDYAAGWLILLEAGGQSATLAAEQVFIPSLTKRSAVAATTPELFKQWQTYLQNI